MFKKKKIEIQMDPILSFVEENPEKTLSSLLEKEGTLKVEDMVQILSLVRFIFCDFCPELLGGHRSPDKTNTIESIMAILPREEITAFKNDHNKQKWSDQGVAVLLTGIRQMVLVCHACQKPKAGMLCSKCQLAFYCDEKCMTKGVSNHASWCCNPNSSYDKRAKSILNRFYKAVIRRSDLSFSMNVALVQPRPESGSGSVLVSGSDTKAAATESFSATLSSIMKDPPPNVGAKILALVHSILSHSILSDAFLFPMVSKINFHDLCAGAANLTSKQLTRFGTCFWYDKNWSADAIQILLVAVRQMVPICHVCKTGTLDAQLCPKCKLVYECGACQTKYLHHLSCNPPELRLDKGVDNMLAAFYQQVMKHSDSLITATCTTDKNGCFLFNDKSPLVGVVAENETKQEKKSNETRQETKKNKEQWTFTRTLSSAMENDTTREILALTHSILSNTANHGSLVSEMNFLGVLKSAAQIPNAEVARFTELSSGTHKWSDFSIRILLVGMRQMILICQGCHRTTAKKEYLCRKCGMVYYCSSECRENSKSEHDKRCCNLDAPCQPGFALLCTVLIETSETEITTTCTAENGIISFSSGSGTTQPAAAEETKKQEHLRTIDEKKPKEKSLTLAEVEDFIEKVGTRESTKINDLLYRELTNIRARENKSVGENLTPFTPSPEQLADIKKKLSQLVPHEQEIKEQVKKEMDKEKEERRRRMGNAVHLKPHQKEALLRMSKNVFLYEAKTISEYVKGDIQEGASCVAHHRYLYPICYGCKTFVSLVACPKCKLVHWCLDCKTKVMEKHKERCCRRDASVDVDDPQRIVMVAPGETFRGKVSTKLYPILACANRPLCSSQDCFAFLDKKDEFGYCHARPECIELGEAARKTKSAKPVSVDQVVSELAKEEKQKREQKRKEEQERREQREKKREEKKNKQQIEHEELQKKEHEQKKEQLQKQQEFQERKAKRDKEKQKLKKQERKERQSKRPLLPLPAPEAAPLPLPKSQEREEHEEREVIRTDQVDWSLSPAKQKEDDETVWDDTIDPAPFRYSFAQAVAQKAEQDALQLVPLQQPMKEQENDEDDFELKPPPAKSNVWKAVDPTLFPYPVSFLQAPFGSAQKVKDKVKRKEEKTPPPPPKQQLSAFAEAFYSLRNPPLSSSSSSRTKQPPDLPLLTGLSLDQTVKPIIKEETKTKKTMAQLDACIVCLDQTRDTAFIPCGCASFCFACADAITKTKTKTRQCCPNCQTPFTQCMKLRLFL